MYRFKKPKWGIKRRKKDESIFDRFKKKEPQYMDAGSRRLLYAVMLYPLYLFYISVKFVTDFIDSKRIK